jgi:hypothetical protein
MQGRRRSALIWLFGAITKIWKPAHDCRLQELEMRNGIGKLLKATLTVRNLATEKILMVVIERFPLEIFIGSISKGHRSSRQHVLYPAVKTRLFLLGRMQRAFDRFQNRANPRAVGVSVSIGGTRFEGLIRRPGLQVIVRPRPQK